MKLKNIFIYCKLSLFQTVLFVIVYGITNYLSQHHLYSLKLHAQWELNIPLIPEFILIYFSLNLLTILPAFMMDEKSLYQLNRAMTFCVLIAGTIFLILPAPSGFNRQIPIGPFAEMFRKLHSVDFNGNTFPSLHITFAYLFSRFLVQLHPKLKYFFVIWFILISASVVFTHQHHLIDIVGGIFLAEIAMRRYYAEA